MNFAMARVAPEKRPHRPPASAFFGGGLGEDMASKMTYGEQLKHPNWQRKRLEVLNHYGFRCYSCRSDEKTLHAHHKHYVKGRMAWEYEVDELEALCEDCHKDAHEDKERIDFVIAQFPTFALSGIADLLVGFGRDHVDDAEWLNVSDIATTRCGRAAWYLGNLSDSEALEVCNTFSALGPDRFMAALRAAVAKDAE